MSTPATYDYPDQYAGDTVAKRTITVTRTSGGSTVAEDLTGVEISWWLARSPGGQIVRQATNGTGITVVDAVAGVFEIDAFTAPEEGVYVHDLQFEYPDGRRRTYFAGSIRVQRDVVKS